MKLSLLPQAFYARDALEVAPALLGKHLRHDDVLLRITEVEAYRWPGDSANHCHSGRRTKRNAPMWGPPGRAYVYLCYGLHHLLNLVTNQEGEAAVVLIRACEPVAGLDTVRARRGGLEGPTLLTGPGKVGSALALDTSFSHHPCFEPGGLEVLEGDDVTDLVVGARVGIGYAEPRHQKAPWRFAVAGSPWVSHPKGLKRPRAAATRRGSGSAPARP